MWITNMPQEMVRVSFLYIYVDIATREPIDTIPMQLWAGFVGVEEDDRTRALTPKIGWLARIADEESDELARLKEKNEFMTLYFYMHKDQKVPHVLSKMDHIRSLNLDFGGNPVVIPEWMDNILIDKLQITGQFTDDEDARLRQRFPKAELKQYVDYTKGLKRLPIEDSEDDSNNIDSVLIVVNGKQLPKQSSPFRGVITVGNGVNAGDTISGIVKDQHDVPLIGATVCERNEKGWIVSAAITDHNGRFTLKVMNTSNKLRFSFVGCRSEDFDIVGLKYDVRLQPVQ